jgi:hypothetical protein
MHRERRFRERSFFPCAFFRTGGKIVFNGALLGQAEVSLHSQKTTLTIDWLREVSPSEQGDILVFLLKLFPVETQDSKIEHDGLCLETGQLYAFTISDLTNVDRVRIDVYESPDGPAGPSPYL